MHHTDPKAWLNPMPQADFNHPRWQKYTETGKLLYDLFQQTSGFKMPPSMPSFFGDGGARTVADVAAAIWLCKNASTLFEEVANTLQIKNASKHLDLTKLAQNIINILKVETRHLSNKTQLELMAKLMVSLGVGVLPGDTDWSRMLRELIQLQFESSSGSRYERPVMQWAIGIELDHPDMHLNERELSFREFVENHPEQPGRWYLNDWAYLLLRLELYRSATPMAHMAVEKSKWAGSLDTYGWALFYEKDYDKAESLLSQAVAPLNPGSADWSEVQYHRLQVALWSERLTDARILIEELQNKAPKDYWTGKAIEMKPLLTRRKKALLRKKRDKYEYEVALSFAGEDRRYADHLARSLAEQGITTFYDDYERSALWGQDLYRYLSEVYLKKAKYCVIFISEHYARKRWTNLECRAAQARAFQENSPYILPIKLDDTEIPGILPTVSYMSWQRDGLELIVETLLAKLGRDKDSHPSA